MTRHIGKLSALFVSKVTKPRLYNDGGNLYLQVKSPTAKSWIFRFNGSRYLGLGSAHVVSLQEARDLAHECRRLRQQGIDPIEAKHAKQTQQRLDKAANAITFKQCVADYIDAHRAGWKHAKHLEQWRNSMTRHVVPVIGDLPVQAIDTTAVHKVLHPVWTAIPETAGRLRGRIEAVLDWAKVLGYRSGENPARWRGHLDKLLPKPGKVRRVEHYAALPYSEVPKFMAALRTRTGTSARALEFCILTATRTAEVLGARHQEFDLKAAVWVIPAQRMKADQEHRVPLSAAALQIIKATAQSGGGFVFPSSSTPGQPLESRQLYKALRRVETKNATTHGFRSAFRDWAAECTNFPREVCEAALAHTVGNKVEAAYRRSDLFEKRRDLMDAWARYCAGAGDADVVPLRLAKK
jgi:integrase